MDVTQATALLAICAEADGRKPNPDAAKLWAEILAYVRFDDARQAVVDHYSVTHRWIMPSDVLAGVARITEVRRKQLEQTDLPPELEAMEDGPEFTAAYLAWVKSGGREVPQGQLTA